MHSSAVNFIGVEAALAAEQLFYRLLGIMGACFASVLASKAAAAAVINFFTAGFVDRTRPAIRPHNLAY